MDKKLARELVKKIGPLEHSKDSHERGMARKTEAKLRKIIRKIPKPRMKA